MDQSRFLRAVALIDQANASDPQWEIWQGERWPKTYLYGLRMTQWLVQLDAGAPETAFLAARAQHVCRWLVPRSLYPQGRKGYLEWRTFLYRLHGEKAARLLAQAGYGEDAIAQARRILMKRGLKRDPQVQLVEDAACLVFLQYEFSAFTSAYPEEKILDVVGKTWGKMSSSAQAAAARLALGEREAELIRLAVAGQAS